MLEQCCACSKQCCNAVLRLKSSLRTVSCNITLSSLIFRVAAPQFYHVDLYSVSLLQNNPASGCTCWQPVRLLNQPTNRLRLVSLSSWSVEQNVRDTPMTTRVAEGAKRVRHEKRETTRKARKNGLSRSSDFLAWKLKCWKDKQVKRDLRVCFAAVSSLALTPHSPSLNQGHPARIIVQNHLT